MAGYKSPLAGYYESGAGGGEYKSPLSGYYPKVTKQDEEDERNRKLKEAFAQAEQASAAAPKPKTLLDIGADVGANVGNFVKSVTVDPLVNGYNAVVNEFRADKEIADKTQNSAKPVEGNEKFVQSKMNEINRAEQAGEINKQRAEQLRNETQSKKQEATKKVEEAKTSYKEKYGQDMKSQDENAADFINGATSIGGVTGLAKLGLNAGKKVAEKSVGQVGKLKQSLSEAAQDEAIRNEAIAKAAPTQASQSLKTSSRAISEAPIDVKTGKPMPKTVEARKNQGFLNDDVLGDGTSTNRVGKAVEDVVTPDALSATPGMAPSRYSSKTLKDSEFVGGETKKKIGTEYQETNNAIRGDATLKQLDIEGVDNFATKVHSRLDSKHITDQTVFDAQGAAQALEARGTEADLQKAAEIYDKLSAHLSKAGQTVQAAAIMSRQTPQGLAYFAQKQFKNAGVDFAGNPKLQKELNDYIAAVKNAPKGSEEMAIARDNVQYFIAKNIPSNKADQIVNFWRSGLLTGPTTTGGALVGNTAQLLNRKLIENPVAVMADMAQSMFTKKRTVGVAKLGELEKGAGKGIKNATSGQYWKTGYDPMTNADKLGKYDQPSRMINYGQGRLGKAVGGYVNGVYKVMGAADQPFRYGAQRETLSSLAQAEVKNQGLKGAEAKSFYDDFMANPPKDALNTATNEAKYQTFQNETRLGNVISGAKNTLRAQGHNKTAAMVDFFVPFNNVPAAVATRLVTNTPIGTASTIIENIIKVRKGEAWDQRAVSKAIGQGMSGLPVLAAGVALGKEGLVTGGYPATKAERDQWEAEGKQPNSVKIGDRWYSLNYIQPFASLLATGAKVAEAQQAGLNPSEVFNQSLASAGNSLLSQSFLQGVQGAIDAVKNPSEYAGRYAANTAAGLIPNIIRSGARAADPNLRETEGIEAGIMGGIPGLRENLPVKTNDDGEALTAKDNFANQYLNPLKPSQVKNDVNTNMNNEAILPASRLKAVRSKEIKALLDKGSVAAAQRKIDAYNEEVTKVLAPYVVKNENNLSDEQLDRIRGMYLGEVWINKKGRPSISSRDDLPS